MLAGRVSLAADATGVGAPVIDMLRPCVAPVPMFALTITGGTAVSHAGRSSSVPKRDLVSAAQVLLQERRLQIAASLPHAETLVSELLAFRVSISASGHDSYAAWRERDHDDLVLAVALAAWLGENRIIAPYPSSPEDPRAHRRRSEIGPWTAEHF